MHLFNCRNVLINSHKEIRDKHLNNFRYFLEIRKHMLGPLLSFNVNVVGRVPADLLWRIAKILSVTFYDYTHIYYCS